MGRETRQSWDKTAVILLGTTGTTSNTCSYLGNILQLPTEYLSCSKHCSRAGNTAVTNKIPCTLVLSSLVGLRDNQ